MPIQSVMPGRPLATMDAVPEVLPVVMPAPGRQIPALLGGEPVVLPAGMPCGLPDQAARQLAAELSGQRSRESRGGRGAAGTTTSVPGPAVVLTLGQDTELALEATECARLVSFLDAVPDRRKRRGRRYRLSYLLAAAVVAMMAADIQLACIGEWVATAPAGLLIALGAPVDRHGRVGRPDTATITRALAASGEDLDRALCAWIGAIRRTHHPTPDSMPLYQGLHLDGKAQKGAARDGRAPMLLSARADDGTVPAQLSISAKTNEIPMFAPLLDRITNLTGTVITADQLHTQRAHATYLHDRGAHYVFTVGENQPKLFAALDTLPWQQIAIEHATVDRGHGRIEVRTIKALPATPHIQGLFPHAHQVFLLERYVYTTDGRPLGAVAVLGITSLPSHLADAAAIAAYVRGHWSVESLHWIRDAVLGEDASTVTGASHAMAALRNLIISILSLRGVGNIARQLRACHRDPYRLPLLLLGLMTPNLNHTAT